MKLGVIGAGFVGRALARVAVASGHEVMIANSRDPATLASAAIALRCSVGTVAEVACFGDVLVLAIPMRAIFELLPAQFDGKVVIDATNYYPQRDGTIAELEAYKLTTTGLLAQQLPAAKVVKAFNAILYDEIEKDARPPGSAQRRALPLAGDDLEAKRSVAMLVDQFGFEPFDAGPLNESWRFERAMPAYCIPLQRDQLARALAEAQRGVEAAGGSWRVRRGATSESRQSMASGPDKKSRAPRQRVGFDNRGVLDIVDTQFHIGPQHDIVQSLAAMDALGIRSALVDELWGFDGLGHPQPSAALEGGGYRSLSPLGLSASLQHPTRFSFIQRIERDDPLLLSRISLLAQTPGCRCLRIHLSGDDERSGFANGDWDEALALAMHHELAVTVMADDAGSLLAPVARRHAGLTLVVDHCGWVNTPDQWHDVLALGELPNVILKWSHSHRAFRRHTDPQQARHDGLVRAIEAFGSDRVMWAGDVSFEESNATWSELLSFVRDHAGVSEEDRAWVLGRTARRVHRWEKT